MDELWQDALRRLLDNDFAAAIPRFSELLASEELARLRPGDEMAIRHNLAVAHALDGDADGAMQLLDENMSRFPAYRRSFLFAAELHRAAARGEAQSSAVAAKLLTQASELLVKPLQSDPNDPQACIIASEVLAACSADDEAVKWHVRALAGIRARHSTLTPNIVAAFADNLADESLHYFSQPPEEAVATGGLTPAAREEGRCIAIVADSMPDDLGPWARWPQLLVTYGAGPRSTSPGHLHVRTVHRWAARFRAAQAVLDSEIPTAVVWDAERDPPPADVASSKALLASAPGAAFTAFAMKPASIDELNILRELFNPVNVPPSTPVERMDEMAATAARWLAADSDLDLEMVSA